MNKDVLDTLRDYKDKCEGLENINDKLSNALLSAENKINKYKEVIDKIRKEINDEYSIMGVKVVQNDTLEDILKEVE